EEPPPQQTRRGRPPRGHAGGPGARRPRLRAGRLPPRGRLGRGAGAALGRGVRPPPGPRAGRAAARRGRRARPRRAAERAAPAGRPAAGPDLPLRRAVADRRALAGLSEGLLAVLVMTLDVGTSSVRALLFDGRGRVVPGSETKLAYRPDGGSDGTSQVDAD